MAMKSSPGSIFSLAEYRDQLQVGPQTRVFGDSASGSSFWKIMAALSVLGQEGFYRRRRGPRRCLGVGAGVGPTHAPRWDCGRGLPLAPGWPPWLPFDVVVYYFA